MISRGPHHDSREALERDLSREKVRRAVMSDDFAVAWKDGDVRKRPLAILSDDLFEALPKDVRAGHVVFDGVRRGKLARRHPEVEIEQYRSLQAALDRGEMLLERSCRKAPSLLVHAPSDAEGKWWRWVIKIDTKRGRLQLVTVFRTGQRKRLNKLASRRVTAIRKWDPARGRAKAERGGAWRVATSPRAVFQPGKGIGSGSAI